MTKQTAAKPRQIANRCEREVFWIKRDQRPGAEADRCIALFQKRCAEAVAELERRGLTLS